MDEPIDVVALGLKRGPRGAAAVVVLLVAIPLGVVAVRSGGESVTPSVPQPEPVLEELAPITPMPAKPKRARAKRTPAPKQVVAAPVLAKHEVPPAAPVKVEVAAVPVAPAKLEEVEAPLPLPPPAPAPESSVAKLDEEEEEENSAPLRDGNGEAIARSIAATKRAAVRACFESELKASPKLHGTVVVELDLAPPNRVNGVRVNDDLGRAAFTSCVEATMRDVKFGSLDEEISVSVPYVLTPLAK